ncbi:hypothetical protein LP420_11825 [Massilia sp. B-10]|nr:hypothetical protein LP420_11825 [Massilia sp. B-10]
MAKRGRLGSLLLPAAERSCHEGGNRGQGPRQRGRARGRCGPHGRRAGRHGGQSNQFRPRKVEADLVYPDTVLAADFAALEGAKLARPVLRGRPLRLTDLVVPEVKDVSSILPPAGSAP